MCGRGQQRASALVAQPKQPHHCLITVSLLLPAALVRVFFVKASLARWLIGLVEGIALNSSSFSALRFLWSFTICAGSDVVDIYNATNGNWSTAVLSAPRGQMAATALPNHGIAIFAGGGGGELIFV
jgi:hypothetical protein